MVADRACDSPLVLQGKERKGDICCTVVNKEEVLHGTVVISRKIAVVAKP
jgi:hypothetical protein